MIDITRKYLPAKSATGLDGKSNHKNNGREADRHGSKIKSTN